ncbi:MAG: hypothetical protein U5N53_12475 [Mycobacterium sp.]|nr:hypothetical protein [Mycobacterium sp.]
MELVPTYKPMLVSVQPELRQAPGHDALLRLLASGGNNGAKALISPANMTADHDPALASSWGLPSGTPRFSITRPGCLRIR